MNCERPILIKPISFNDIFPMIKDGLNRKDIEVVVTDQIPGKNRQDDPWLTDWGKHWRVTLVEEDKVTLKPRSLVGASDVPGDKITIERDKVLFTGFTVYSLHTYGSTVLNKVEKVYWSTI